MPGDNPQHSIGLTPPDGANVVVSGGCGGIGRVVVAGLLEHGCHVSVIDLPASVEAHPPPTGVQVVAADATDEAQVDTAITALGDAAVYGFVNLCGFTLPRQPLEDFSLAEWHEIVQGNLDAAFLLCTRMLPLLRRSEDARIVNVASSLAVKASKGYGPYATAKGGMLALTRMLAEENAPGIRVNAVAPNAVRTEFLTGGTGRGASSRSELLDLDAYARSLPLQRVAEPLDVAGPILFLLSPAARFMTGQTLHVNGGLWQP